MRIQPGVGYTFDSSSKGFTLDTAEQFPDNPIEVTHPFKVIGLGPSGSNYRYRVVSGTLNNVVPEIDDVVGGTEALLDRSSSGIPNPPIGQLTISTATKESWIYVRAGKSSGGDFPDTDITQTSYPKVISSDVELSDTDTYGYILIAKFTMDSATAPTVGSVFQYVTGSLWGDRLKLGTLTAKYYYARI